MLVFDNGDNVTSDLLRFALQNQFQGSHVARIRFWRTRAVRHYNEERLHAGLGDPTPAEYYRGDPAARRAERAAKLEQAQQKRQRINEERLKAA